jgi:antitoxin PrlF
MTKEHYTTITRKGQITIPVQIRRRLKLEEGDRIAVVLDGEQVRLRRTEGVVAQTAGLLKVRGRTLTAEQEREQAEKAIAEETAVRT